MKENMIMPKKCVECLKNINKNHLEDLDFQVEQVWKEAKEIEQERIKDLIDKLYKKHSNKVSHTFIFILKKEIKSLK